MVPSSFSSDAHGPWTGSAMGGYRIGSLLGSGAAAAVYEATHQTGGDVMAMKILRASLQNRPVAQRRFERETQTAALVRHPRIVRIFEDGVEDDGTRWQVFERLRGRDLSSVMIARQLRIDEVRTLGVQLLNALTAVHERGFVHRDVKPENVFVLDEPAFSIKLLDFGVAKGVFEPALTDPGIVVGTPQYMAPEQVTGDRPITPASDLFGVGAVLFHALTGHPVVEDDNIGRLLARVAKERAPRVATRRPDTPPALARIIDRALEPRPADRFHSASEMASLLLSS